MTTGPSQDIGNGTGPWLEGQLAVNAKPQAGKSWDNSFSITLPLMAAYHHAKLVLGDALAVLEVRQWQALEAFSQRHAATT